ncbi:MAG: ABC transporter permease [Chloroflexi bacterium RBG_16_56_8]|nr:MAG: ABC transporter permease [Chloroflexi bacterium RBG_16_56_8]
MIKYIGLRAVQIVFTFFAFMTLIYFILESQPGNIVDFYTNDPDVTAEQKAAMRRAFGYDRPLYVQYLSYLGNFLSGNLGVSLSNYPRPVVDIIVERAPRTIVLFVTATVVSFTFGFTMGKIVAWRRGKLTEYVVTFGGVTLYTIFLPWFGLMMIWLFAFVLGWFPLGKFLDPVLWREAKFTSDDVFRPMLLTGLLLVVAFIAAYFISRRMDPLKRGPTFWVGIVATLSVMLGAWALSPYARYALDILHHLALPVITLALVSFAGSMLLTRNSMLETLREDFILAARAKGLPEKVIRDKHAARNAMLPVVTSFVFSLAFAIDGGVITETVFSWPGMGLTLIGAVTVKDIPLAIGALAFTGTMTLIAHLGADILYAYLDPRIRYT